MEKTEIDVVVRCLDYDDPTKIIDETKEEYLCEYCAMRGKECDGKGNITISSTGRGRSNET